VIFWERQSHAERMAAMREIQLTLRRHHHEHPPEITHPSGGFLVPESSRSLEAVGVAAPGQVPSWAL
jgi:hypothetical protein